MEVMVEDWSSELTLALRPVLISEDVGLSMMPAPSEYWRACMGGGEGLERGTARTEGPVVMSYEYWRSPRPTRDGFCRMCPRGPLSGGSFMSAAVGDGALLLPPFGCCISASPASQSIADVSVSRASPTLLFEGGTRTLACCEGERPSLSATVSLPLFSSWRCRSGRINAGLIEASANHRLVC